MLFEFMYNNLGLSVFPLIILMISALMSIKQIIEVPPHAVSIYIIEEMKKSSKDQQDFEQHMDIYAKEVTKYYTHANIWVLIGTLCAIAIVIINFVEVYFL